MANDKTIVILTPGFPESESDTTCLPLQHQLVRTIQEVRPGLRVVVLSFQYPYHKTPYHWFGIPVIPFDGKNKGGLSKLMLRRKINSSLEKIHKSDKIVGILSFWYNECALVGKKFADRSRINHFCWILGQDAKKENDYPRRLPPRESELIALSDFVQREFEKNHGIRPRFVVPPGIDEKLFDQSPIEKDIDFLGVGSLIALKQYFIFLGVIAELKKQRPRVKAVIAGKGPEKEKLAAHIEMLGISENVTFAGELPYLEVLQLMKRSRVLLHPSSYEGFGCVCIEALFAGAHVISFCKPMDADISHWHIVTNKQEMVAKAWNILRDANTEYKSVPVHSIRDTVKGITDLIAPA